MGIAGFAAAAILGTVLTLSAAAQTASTSGGPPMRTQAIAPITDSSATFSTAEEPAPAAGTLVDINSASAVELGKVRFIGRKRAAAIVSGRPWRSPDELVAKKIVPQKYYDRIKDQLVAR